MVIQFIYQLGKKLGIKMSKNDITGDEIRTKPSNDKYSLGWDRIFKGNSGKDLYLKVSKEYRNKMDWEDLSEELQEYYNEVAALRVKQNAT